jgi:hypothetical protein
MEPPAIAFGKWYCFISYKNMARISVSSAHRRLKLPSRICVAIHRIDTWAAGQGNAKSARKALLGASGAKLFAPLQILVVIDHAGMNCKTDAINVLKRCIWIRVLSIALRTDLHWFPVHLFQTLIRKSFSRE